MGAEKSDITRIRDMIALMKLISPKAGRSIPDLHFSDFSFFRVRILAIIPYTRLRAKTATQNMTMPLFKAAFLCIGRLV